MDHIAGRVYVNLTRVKTGFNSAITFHVGAAWDEDRSHLGRIQQEIVRELQRLPGVPPGKKQRGQYNLQIDKEANIAVVVKRDWANLHGVKMFLRQPENVQAEIRGMDESHILFATVLDADDVRGVWIELAPHKPKPDSAAEQFKLLVPWSQILAIVVANEFSAAIHQEARKIGFTGEIERE